MGLHIAFISLFLSTSVVPQEDLLDQVERDIYPHLSLDLCPDDLSLVTETSTRGELLLVTCLQGRDIIFQYTPMEIVPE